MKPSRGGFLPRHLHGRRRNGICPLQCVEAAVGEVFARANGSLLMMFFRLKLWALACKPTLQAPRKSSAYCPRLANIAFFASSAALAASAV